MGVRELKNRIGRYLGRVRAGERLTVTDRGRPVAILSLPPVTPSDVRVEAMVRAGIARWSGGKPRGSSRPPRVSGPSVAKAVIEDRR